MDRISGLSDELLIKILSFLPTKVAVSTSILSKQWECLWMWLPKLEYETTELEPKPALRDFIDKNLPLHRAPIIESLCIRFSEDSFEHEDIKQWVGIVVSRSVRELSICCGSFSFFPNTLLPSSLYTCKSLVALKLEGKEIFVDVPQTVSLPSLKTLKLGRVTYSNDDSLGLLLSSCPVLEELIIEREDDDVGAFVVMVPSLKKFSLWIDGECSDDGCVIVTPSLKYFKVEDYRESFSYSIEHMSKLEVADIVAGEDLEKLLESIKSVKRLSLDVLYNSREESVYRAGIVVFNQLEHLKLYIENDYWSKLLVRFLNDSPKLRVLSLYVDPSPNFEDYERIIWEKKQSSVPKCLLESLETFEFVGYSGRPEERDFLSFFFKNACCLKSSSIQSSTTYDPLDIAFGSEF